LNGLEQGCFEGVLPFGEEGIERDCEGGVLHTNHRT
jgi:hypothetical protein